MIIIYNISGLLIGLLGLFVGALAFVVAQSLTVGLLFVAASWISCGLWWRNSKPNAGVKRPYPALFFVPLPVLAAPVCLLAVLTFFAEAKKASSPPDPRSAQLDADEHTLDSAPITGDKQLSGAILKALDEAGGKDVHVFTRRSERGVLALVKLPDLKEYSEKVRKDMLAVVSLTVKKRLSEEPKAVYVAIKGKYAFGAIHAPPAEAETGSIVVQSPLYAFYDDVANVPQAMKADEAQTGRTTHGPTNPRSTGPAVAKSNESNTSVDSSKTEQSDAADRVAAAPADATSDSDSPETAKPDAKRPRGRVAIPAPRGPGMLKNPGNSNRPGFPKRPGGMPNRPGFPAPPMKSGSPADQNSPQN